MGIKFDHVSYLYQAINNQGYLALNDVSLAIKPEGELITLIGETGSGKSTLVQHMNALLIANRGTVTIFDVPFNQETRKDKSVKRNPIRKRVGLVFQFPEYQLFEETVEKDIMFGPKNFGVSDEKAKAIAAQMIEVVGLDASYLSRSPFNLSGGEKKRVSIAGILAMEPDILILDEPTSGLDPQGRDALLRVFDDIHQRLNKTVIIITHDMNTVYHYAKRVLVMQQGSLVFDGKPVDLFEQKNIDAWNLDVPDIIKLTASIEKFYGQTMPFKPQNIDEIAQWIQEVSV